MDNKCSFWIALINMFKEKSIAEMLDEISRGNKPKKKRVTLTPGQRIHIWEHPKQYGRRCSICHDKITRLSDLQLDHTYPYSKGGKKLNLAHGHCNKIKGSGSLGKIQKALGLKKKPKRKVKKNKVKRSKPKNLLNVPIIRFPKLYNF